MGGGASTRAAEEEAYHGEGDLQTNAPGSGETASDLAELLFGLEESSTHMLSEGQQQQLSELFALLAQPGWRVGRSKKARIPSRFMFHRETGLYYACFHCDVADTAQSMFEDFSAGRAQQRYSEVCNEELILSETERQSPSLGPERLVRGIYRMPYPLQDRDFVWTEWSALLPTTDGGSLYISIAQSPSNEEEVCASEPDRYIRGHLRLSATFARQAQGATACQAGFIIQGDIKGKMPKSMQNLMAGNASTYLARFRDAHGGAPAEPVAA